MTWPYVFALLFAFPVLLIMSWGMVEVAIELFRKRQGTGIIWYDGGPKFDMSNWFDRVPKKELALAHEEKVESQLWKFLPLHMTMHM